MCLCLVLGCFIFFLIPICICFSKENISSGVFRGGQYPHAEDQSCLLPQFLVDTYVTDG